MIDDMTDDIMDVYMRDGVALVPGVFSPREMDSLRLSALYSLGSLSPDAPYGSGYRVQEIDSKSVESPPHPYPAIWFWPSLSNYALESVRRDPRIQHIVRDILGNDVRQLNNQLYFRLPGDGDAFNWHRDNLFRKGMSDFFQPSTDYVQTIIAIDRVDTTSGGLYFDTAGVDSELEMATKATLRDAPRMENRPDTVRQYDMSPGDMLVWNANTPHASRQNGSDRGRMTYMNGFATASGCQPDVWPEYLVDGELEESDPERIPYV